MSQQLQLSMLQVIFVELGVCTASGFVQLSLGEMDHPRYDCVFAEKDPSLPGFS
jgi:hypothetical protein